jgi:hypothetical protein
MATSKSDFFNWKSHFWPCSLSSWSAEWRSLLRVSSSKLLRGGPSELLPDVVDSNVCSFDIFCETVSPTWKEMYVLN